MAVIRFAFKPGITYGQARTAYAEIGSIGGPLSSADLPFPSGMDNEPLPPDSVETMNVPDGNPMVIADQLKHIDGVDPTSVQIT